jgi:hypothetical protein
VVDFVANSSVSRRFDTAARESYNPAMRTGVLVVVGVLLSAFCLSSVAFAQTNWTRTYGRDGEDRGHSVQQTVDGGFIVAGSTESLSTGDNDVYLIRTDAQGDTLWTRSYGGTRHDFGYSVQQTSDGGYIIAGTTLSFGAGDYDVYLIKTDALGDTLWTRTFGGTYTDEGNSVRQTSDGGYIIAGTTVSFGAGYFDVYLIKTNAQGDILWTRTYGGKRGEWGSSVQQTTDGGYVIAGSAVSFGAGTIDAYLIKTNAQGDTLWTRTYGGDETDQARSVAQTSDGGYIIAGLTNSVGARDYDVYLIKTDALGDTLWTKTYGEARRDRGYSVRQTTDGGYIIAGSTRSFGAGAADVWLLRTNVSGDTLWTRTYGGTSYYAGYAVQQTSDGGYIISGYADPFDEGYGDVYLIRTNGKLDVGPIAIQSPPGVVDSGISYVPRAVVRNFGVTSGSIVQVTMNIGSGYSQTVQETLVSVPLDTVEFPAWTAEPVGSISITCFTSLPGDEDPANDTIRDSIQVLPPPWHDVGAVAIVTPSGSVRAGDNVIPRARIRNFGNRQERFFDTRFRIGTSYNEKVNVADALPPDSTAELTFPPWVAEAGNWTVSCSTMLASDVVRANDKVSSSVRVFPQSLQIEPDQSDRIEAGQSRMYRFYALIQGDTGAVVEVARPSVPAGWSLRLGNATGADDLTDTDGDGIPDLGYVAPGESGWFSLDVTAPSGTQGDTASLGQGVFLVAGHVGDRPDIADTAVLSLTLMPAFSVHNFPNPFSDHTAFVIGLPEDGKASLTVYTRAGERVCRVIENTDMPAGVHVVPWNAVNDNGRPLAPGTYEYLLDHVHQGKTDRIHKRLVLTGQ